MTTLALIDHIGGWWTDLRSAQQFFYGIGIVAGLVAIVLGVLALLGLDHHEGIDAVGGHDSDLDNGVFSVKTLTGFFLGFGWSGGLALSYGFTLLVAIAIALACGAALMALIVIMFRAVLSMRSDGTMRIADAVGSVGTVYITLPADKADGGQVTVSFHGRQETFQALNTASRSVASGEKIRVVSVIDSRTVLVEPL